MEVALDLSLLIFWGSTLLQHLGIRTSFSGAWSDMADICHMWSVLCYSLHLNTSKHFFYWEGGQTLEQLAQTGCGVSHLSIYGPGQPAVNDPADWAGGLDYMISKGPPQPKWWQVFVYCAVFYAGRRVAWVLILHFVGMHFRKERRERCSLHME